MFHVTPTPIEIVFNLHGINKMPTKQNVRGWSSIPKRITNGIQSINGFASAEKNHPLTGPFMPYLLVLVVILVMHWCFCWWSLLVGTESGLWIDEAHRLDLIFINTQTFNGTSLFIATSLRYSSPHSVTFRIWTFLTHPALRRWWVRCPNWKLWDIIIASWVYAKLIYRKTYLCKM